MARRRKMAGMSTGTVVLIAGGGLVLVYLLMQNKTATPPPTVLTTGMSPATAAINAQASVTNTEVTQGANTVNNLINSIFS